MIFLKTPEEVEKLRKSCLLVSETIAAVGALIRPGITTLELDRRAETFIRDHGAEPAFLNYKGFPNTLCTSVNDAVVHGVPNERPLQEGDIISVDCGVKWNGWYGDSAYTFSVGAIPTRVKQLMADTKASLLLGIAMAVPGKRIGDLAFAIQEYCEKQHGYGVVRELVGHGIGKKLHEEPEVPNFGRRGQGIKFVPGMVIAVEPMINLGKRQVYTSDQDGWTIYTDDHQPSAHFEHTICVTSGEPDLLTTFAPIESAIRKNPVLQDSI